MNQNERIVILGGPRRSTRIIFHALNSDFDIAKVIVEERVPMRAFWQRRIRSLGWRTVLGQLLFGISVLPYLRLSSRGRIRSIFDRFQLNDSPIDPSKVAHVSSVNSGETRRLLREIQPRVVAVSGTRIIGVKTLNASTAVFINMHAGMTPLYRGVHGAYWALTRGERSACGVTVHLVDKGIDTGGILEQDIIEPTHHDNFATYPYLQIGAGIPLLKSSIRREIEGDREISEPPSGESRLWSHPTLLQYLGFRLKGVK